MTQQDLNLKVNILISKIIIFVKMNTGYLTGY